MTIKKVANRNYNQAELLKRGDFRFRNPNKRYLFELATQFETDESRNIEFSRWKPNDPLPNYLGKDLLLKSKAGFFKYENTLDGYTDWYMNFAHSDVFCGYGGQFFAQDEIQVAEHPGLAGLRMAVLEEQFTDCSNPNLKMLSVESRTPTPILVSGVERRCAVSIEPNQEIGLPNGLYGREFSQARPDSLEKAVKVLKSPTQSNIVCMEAPQYGSGKYTRAEIEHILKTAGAGFEAVKEKTDKMALKDRVVIHSGYWGCGAYGGNKVLMAWAQLVAASWHLDKLVFYTGNDPKPFDKAAEIFATQLGLNTSKAIAEMLGIGFVWGESDGN